MNPTLQEVTPEAYYAERLALEKRLRDIARREKDRVAEIRRLRWAIVRLEQLAASNERELGHAVGEIQALDRRYDHFLSGEREYIASQIEYVEDRINKGRA